jgi:hypothetical protein
MNRQPAKFDLERSVLEALSDCAFLLDDDIDQDVGASL